MTDSITEEDLNRTEKHIDMDNVHNRQEYEHAFQQKFGINLLLKEYLWNKRVWQKTLQQYSQPGVARRWTADEESFLAKNKDKRTVWLARHFPTPRSYKSVWSKQHRMKA